MRRNRILAFHPKRNRLLKATWGVLLILALVPLGTPPAYGWSEPWKNGDPFSNGTFWPSEGTFQAIIRGKNLTGVATFSTVGTGEDITSSGGGIFSVFFNSVTYVGNVNSAIDVHSGQIAATFQGTAGEATQGTGSTVVNTEFVVLSQATESVNATTVTNTFDPSGSGTLTSTTTITTPVLVTTETSGLIETIANFDFTNVLYSAGSFVARLRDSWPNQSFDGKGTFSFSEVNVPAEGIPQVVTETVEIKVDGVRVADSVQTFTPLDVQVPTVLVTTFETQTVGGGETQTSGGGSSTAN